MPEYRADPDSRLIALPVTRIRARSATGAEPIFRLHPDEVLIQDGPNPFRVSVREVEGEERAAWWDRAVAVYPPYAEYQENTDRVIPVLVAAPA